MRLFSFLDRNVKPRSQLPEKPIDHCLNLIEAIKSKADHNKNEALFCLVLVIGASLVAPLFVTLGEGLFFGKIVPSALSLLAAGSTTWLQVRKPQQLWAIYRSAQRELEDCAASYTYRIGEYEQPESREKLLAKNVLDIAMGVHHKWVPLVPNPESLQIADNKKRATPERTL
jgi:hypothetical protein